MLLGYLKFHKGKRHANVSMISQAYLQALVHRVRPASVRQLVFECLRFVRPS